MTLVDITNAWVDILALPYDDSRVNDIKPKKNVKIGRAHFAIVRDETPYKFEPRDLIGEDNRITLTEFQEMPF